MICSNVRRLATVGKKSGISLMLVALWLRASGSLPAQTVTTLYEFGAGGNPDGNLVQGTDGNLYAGDAFPGAYPDGISRSVNWSEFGFIPSGGRFNPHERMLSPSNAHQLHKLWSFFTGCSGPFCGGSSAAVADGVVYVGSYDGYVYALNAATGVKLWSFATGGEVFSSPAVANGVVYVGSNDQNVYALNATTGAKLWSYTAGYDVTSSPVVVDGVVYIGAEDGNVYAL